MTAMMQQLIAALVGKRGGPSAKRNFNAQTFLNCMDVIVVVIVCDLVVRML